MEGFDNQLLEAFQRKEWARARNIIETAQEAERLEQAELEVKQRRSEFEGRLAAAGKERPAGFKGREIPLQVTQGAVQYSYLLVTRALKRKQLARDETLTIHVPSTGETFTTGIYARNNILLDKPAVGRFYKAAAVQAWDIVLLEEIAPKEWNLTKTAHRSYISFALEGMEERISRYGLGGLLR